MDENNNKVNPTPEEINAKMKEEAKRIEDEAKRIEEEAKRIEEERKESEKVNPNVNTEYRRTNSSKGFDLGGIQGEDVSGEFTDDDIFKNKTMAALAYIIFFIPLIAVPESKFGKFHANQGLILLITGIVGTFVLGLIPILGWILLPIFSLAIFVIGVIAIVNTLNGKAQKLPFIGNINLINK
ncbi:MAG: hypothetical protein WBI17_06145 [Clostridiaceae bacterium]